MMLTSIVRSPLLLIAIICECLAETMRGIVWLIKVTQLPRLETLDEAPLGFWRCIHAAEKFSPSFIPGGVYQTMPMATGSADIRIIPTDSYLWAPYWERQKQRFCYEELDFEYIGPTLPAGEICLSSFKSR